MRPPLSLVMITALAFAPIANAQTATTQPATTQPAAVPAAARAAAHAAHRSHSRQSPSRRATDTAHASSPAGKSGSVLDLGATDITGNKELPKVLAIVPWKDSLGAGGVIKPSDSLLDEVLQPVDRGVFQRRIRYYGQLKSTGVAPVGDSH